MVSDPIDRRTVLLATATVSSSVLAGCLGTAQPDSPDEGNERGTSATEIRTPKDPDPSALIDEFLDAAREENRDTLAKILHPESPIHPSKFEGTDWEFQGESYESYDYTNATILETDAPVEEIRKYEGMAFWFQGRELEDVFGDTDARIVSVDIESNSHEEQPNRWVLAKENDEWRIFWMAKHEETPDNPEAAFEEPIADEDDDVVAEVEWEVDPVDHAGPTPGDRFEYAKVHLTESPGIEAERIVIESTIAGGQVEFYSTERSTATTSWAGSWANVQIDPGGDQIVVTAVNNGREEVVYRGHYRPKERS